MNFTLAFLPAAVGFVLGMLFICDTGKVAPMLFRRDMMAYAMPMDAIAACCTSDIYVTQVSHLQAEIA